MKYRVKQTAKDQFIPQVKANMFSRWGAIRHYRRSAEPFIIFFYHPDYAMVDTLKEAYEVIKLYKGYKANKEGYPIYHNEIQD